jgi:hypothetical protein
VYQTVGANQWYCHDGATTPGCSRPRWRFGVNGTTAFAGWTGYNCDIINIPTAFVNLTSATSANQWDWARFDFAVVDLSNCSAGTKTRRCMRLWALWLGLGTWLLGVGSARAQELDTWHGDDPLRVPVVFSGLGGSVRLEVAEADTEHVVAECQRRCVLYIAPGRYVVQARNLQTGADHQIGIRVRGASRFVFAEGDDTARTTGLVLGIVGPALLLTGMVLITPVVMSAGCHDPDCTTEGEGKAARIGLGALLVGAIATPVGWSVFAGNRTRLE